MTVTAAAAFFSYSRDDASFVIRLAADLKAAGANVWLDQLDISPGQRWDRAIEDALKACPRLIVILSPASVQSTNVMDEVSFALEERKTVIPIFHRSCEIPFRLRRLQYVDFQLDYAHGLNELLKVLAPPQKPPEPTTTGSPEVRTQVRADTPEMRENRIEAEEAHQEDKRPQALEQARPEMERMQTPARESRTGFLSQFPAVTKGIAAALAVLIVAFLLSWKFLPLRSNKQTEETKREPQVETINPPPVAPRQPTHRDHHWNRRVKGIVSWAHAQSRFCYRTEAPLQDQTPLRFFGWTGFLFVSGSPAPQAAVLRLRSLFLTDDNI